MGSAMPQHASPRDNARLLRTGSHGRDEMMADSKKKRRRHHALIAVGEKYEVTYWSNKFKITPAKLKAAVAAAGHSSKKVEAYLKRQRAAKKRKKA